MSPWVDMITTLTCQGLSSIARFFVAFSVEDCGHLVLTQSSLLRLTSKVVQFSQNKSQLSKKKKMF